jgi:hypothetical protein
MEIPSLTASFCSMGCFSLATDLLSQSIVQREIVVGMQSAIGTTHYDSGIHCLLNIA